MLSGKSDHAVHAFEQYGEVLASHPLAPIPTGVFPDRIAIVGTLPDETGRGKRSRRQKARAYPRDLMRSRLHKKGFG
jgi:hypothetical protein